MLTKFALLRNFSKMKKVYHSVCQSSKILCLLHGQVFVIVKCYDANPACNFLINSNVNLSRPVRKPTMWFPTRPDTNRPVQSQKMARSLKFRILVEEELYYPSSENKGADQLRSYLEADLRLCFRLGGLFVFQCGGSFI